MTISFQCDNCGKSFQTDASFAGKKCKCKQCGHVFVIPEPRASTASGQRLQTFSEPDPAAVLRPRPAARPAAASPPPASPARPASAPRPAKPSRPNYLDDEDDPYSIDSEPSPKRSAVAAEDDDEFLPPRAKPVELKPAKKKKKKSSASSYQLWDPIPGNIAAIMIGIIIALGVMAMVTSAGKILLIGFLAIAGISLLLYGGLGQIVVPFQESVACGLMCLFLPIYPLYYLITRWDAMRGPFLNALFGALMFYGMIAGVAINLAKNAPNGVGGFPDVAQMPVAPPNFGGAPGGGGLIGDAIPEAPLPPPPPQFAGGPPARPEFGPPMGIGPRMRMPQQPVIPVPPPAPNANAADTLTLNVTGLIDKDTADAFGEKLGEMLQKEYGNFHMFSSGGGARRTYTISPISDAQDFARRITFAKVTSVNGQTVSVEAKPLPPGERRPPDHDFIGQVLFDLKSPTLQKRKEALSRLANAPPDDKHKVEVAKAIEPMLKDPDGFARSDAAKALSVWGGPENTPALVAALRDPAFNVRWAVLDAMAIMKDPAAAEPLAAFLATNDRSKAVEALKGIGAPAEPAVIKYLSHGDVFTRMEAAKILAVIGTEKSVAPLQELIRKTNNHGLDAMAAGEALDQLGAPRFGNPPRKKGGLVPRTRNN